MSRLDETQLCYLKATGWGAQQTSADLAELVTPSETFGVFFI
jgi:hypothetical protein